MKKQTITTDLVNAIRIYNNKLDALENAKTLTQELIINVLLARDYVHYILNTSKLDEASQLININKLDERLHKITPETFAIIPLASLRNTRVVSTHTWWWNLDQKTEPLPTIWLYNAATSLVAVFILGFVLEIVPRFIDGGSENWGIPIIILQGFMAVFAASVLFNEEGKGIVDRLLVHVNIPQKKMSLIRLISAIFIAFTLILLWLALPSLSRWYNNQGYEITHQSQPLFAKAEVYFKRALRLDANNYVAHYNLGDLYETLGNYEQARTEYAIAAKSGLDYAYNNLGRLLVVQGNYGQAVQVIIEGLNRFPNSDSLYYFRKNLGWVRFKQARYEEAVIEFQAAIKAKPNEADAYCLIAQVLDAQSLQSDDEWFKCQTLATKSLSPEMDEWKYLAELHRSQKGSNP